MNISSARSEFRWSESTFDVIAAVKSPVGEPNEDCTWTSIRRPSGCCGAGPYNGRGKVFSGPSEPRIDHVPLFWLPPHSAFADQSPNICQYPAGSDSLTHINSPAPISNFPRSPVTWPSRLKLDSGRISYEALATHANPTGYGRGICLMYFKIFSLNIINQQRKTFEKQ
jgi:hypothetical protein